MKRRAFLGKTSIGVGAVSLAACGGGGGGSSAGPVDIGGGDTPDVSPFSNTAAGSWVYDEATYLLSLNFTEVDFDPSCNYSTGMVDLKLRALFHDFFFLRIELESGDDSANEIYIQQWARQTVSSGEPSLEGVWKSPEGYEITFVSDGSFTLSVPVTVDCSNSGMLGEMALAEHIFRQGVASGDPGSSSVILWSRAQGMGSAPVAVTLEVATDHLFTQIVETQSLTALEANDFIVKPTVTNLQAATVYYYRFSTPNKLNFTGLPYQSLTGRAKTLPLENAEASTVGSLKFALTSCSSFPHGFFNAYRQMARFDDLDAVLHMGDYIYDYPGIVEGGENPNDYGDTAAVEQGRIYRYGNRTETISLADYRLRFRNYREDADLQLIHSRYAFINTWDDHETANDSYDPDADGTEGGAENHNDNGRDEGLWEPRKAAAAQAYNEWLPITDVRGPGTSAYNDPRLNRRFRFGQLADLTVLDTRIQGRHAAPTDTSEAYNVDDSSAERNSYRRLMSPEQEDFLTGSLTDAQSEGVVWKLLGQQIMCGHLVGPPLGGPTDGSGFPDQNWSSVVNADQWDGYDADRERLFSHIKGDAADDGVDIDNVVVLTGDIHTSWAIDLVDDPRKRTIPASAASPSPIPTSQRYGVEFVTPSVTSPGLPDTGQEGVSLAETLRQVNPHMSYINFDKRGYMIIEIDETAAQGTWYHLNSILDREDEEQTVAAVYAVDAGTNQLVDRA